MIDDPCLMIDDKLSAAGWPCRRGSGPTVLLVPHHSLFVAGDQELGINHQLLIIGPPLWVIGHQRSVISH